MSDTFYKSKEWRTLRVHALRRDGYCCTVCRASVRMKGASRVDHIVTRKARPDLALTLSNLRTLCVSCDNKRHSEKGGNQHDRPAIAVTGYPDAWSGIG